MLCFGVLVPDKIADRQAGNPGTREIVKTGKNLRGLRVFFVQLRVRNHYQNRIINGISKLCAQPRPAGAKKLSGRDTWRVSIGSHRVIYEINDDKLTVLVVTLDHRKDIYAKGISYESDIGETRENLRELRVFFV